MDEKLIFVTGYGIFAGHEEKNASWEAVKILPEVLKIDENVYKIEKLKVEVSYEDVDKKVEEIWAKNPYLVVHIGVHGKANKIHIEKCANNGFMSKDYACKTLCDPFVCLEKSGKCKKLETKFDVDKITTFLNENHRDMFVASCDVGQYLCGYIYLKSLDKDPQKSLFIHVPCIDKPYSTEETSAGILKVIEQCILMSKTL